MRNEERLSFRGYRLDAYNEAAFWATVVFTGGLAYLPARWSVRWWLALRLARPSSSATLDDATHVLLSEGPGTSSGNERLSLSKVEISGSAGSCMRMVQHKCQRYLVRHGALEAVPDMPEGMDAEIRRATRSLDRQPDAPWEPSSLSRLELEATYGPNSMRLEVKSPLQLVWEEMWHPYFVFQYFSVLIWMLTDYVFYSVVILLITWGAILTQVYTSWSQSRRLAAMVNQSTSVSRVVPGMPWSSADLMEDVPSESLVPGDVVAVSSGAHLPCDMVLLLGSAVMDEAMLTGESVPVRKAPWHGREPLDPLKHSEYILSGGTVVLQAAGPSARALGMVLRTGFKSAKGRLVQSMLHPKDLEPSFERDTLVFICLMSALALVMYCASLVALVRHHDPAGDIFLRFLDMITVAVPPALPASMQVAIALSVWRLQALKIHVIEARRIIMAGALNVIAFDKTGTLTENTLQVESVWLCGKDGQGGGLVVPGRAAPHRLSLNLDSARREPSPPSTLLQRGRWHLLPFISSSGLSGGLMMGNADHRPYHHQEEQEPLVAQHHVSWDDDAHDPSADDSSDAPRAADEGAEAPPEWKAILATCHGLATISGAARGDPLDEVLFRHSGWELLEGDDAVEDPRRPGRPYAILRRFPFTSEDMRCSVVVQVPDGGLRVFCKGSPERLAEITRRGELPEALENHLQAQMAQGARCVAIAAGSLMMECTAEEIAAMPRGDLEASLEVLGLVAMTAPLKPSSRSTIAMLEDAGVRTLMITGDHIATAIHTAQQAGMISSEKPVVCVEATGRASGSLAPVLCVGLLDPKDEMHSSGAGRGGGSSPRLQAPSQHQELLQMVLRGEAELAATGAAWEIASQDPLFASEKAALLECGTVFGRMPPTAKAELVAALGRRHRDELMQPGNDEATIICGASHGAGGSAESISCRVGFVGDGANDIMALREAFVSLSLCEAEASIAAPLTSKDQSPFAIVKAMSEGRCALACSYELVQYTVAYAYIQVIGLNILYFLGLEVADFQYLIQDLLFVTSTAALMGYTGPRAHLSTQSPPPRLLTRQVVGCVVVQIIMVTVFMTATLKALQALHPDFFQTAELPGYNKSRSPQGSVIFVLSLAQLLTAALVTNRTTAFRRAATTNLWLVLALVAQAAFILLIVLLPSGPGCWLTWTFAAMVPMPRAVRVHLLLSMGLYLAATLAVDWVVRSALGGGWSPAYHHLFKGNRRTFRKIG